MLKRDMLETLELKFLYYFSNELLQVVEVKVLNLGENAPLNQVFHWLSISQETQQFQRLLFRSMKSGEEKEYRQFEQGELYFDKAHAHLQLTNSGDKKVHLTVNSTNSITQNLQDQIQEFLLKQFNV